MTYIYSHIIYISRRHSCCKFEASHYLYLLLFVCWCVSIYYTRTISNSLYFGSSIRWHRQWRHREPFDRQTICWNNVNLLASSTDAAEYLRTRCARRALSATTIESCIVLSMSNNQELEIGLVIFSQKAMRARNRWMDICKETEKKN